VQDGLRAWGDGRLVRAALGCLLDNAWKFTSRQSIAAITVGANIGPQGESVFFVRDSGRGFDLSRAGDLFRKFQRLHAPGEFPGSGAGLVAVGRIIERHGGRVWAESSPEQGTAVYFTLPMPMPS
jgi:light-regulated signal transduction histidine kinase (bacteriophytochrome)